MLSTMSAVGARDAVASDAAERLMSAALDAFAEKGFHATTTRDIASRAGLSPAGVYVHFASKEELLFALSQRGHLEARDLLVAAAERGRSSPVEALRSIMATFAEWHAEHFRDARIVQYEFQHLTREHREIVLALRKEMDRLVQRVVESGVSSGDFDVPNVPETALALLSMAVDVARWYDPEIKRTPQAIGIAYGELGLRLVTANRVRML